jgi:hypothetical protein
VRERRSYRQVVFPLRLPAGGEAKREARQRKKRPKTPFVGRHLLLNYWWPAAAALALAACL